MLFGGVPFASWWNGAQEEDLSTASFHLVSVSKSIVSLNL